MACQILRGRHMRGTCFQGACLHSTRRRGFSAGLADWKVPPQQCCGHAGGRQGARSSFQRLMHRQAETSQRRAAVALIAAVSETDRSCCPNLAGGDGQRADDVLEVAEVYMSLLSVLRRILLCDDPVQNVFALWPSIGTVRKHTLPSFGRRCAPKLGPRVCVERLGLARNSSQSEMGGDVHGFR